jgi:hypothetical protein
MSYSQYNYYQSNPIAQPQQQQQQGTTTTAQTWNGQQWVIQSAAAPPPPPGIPTQPQPPQIYKHGKTHAQLIQHYTAYYHYWNAQTEEAKLQLQHQLLGEAERSEAERREKWASYYSSNSAALAHYHLSLSQGSLEPYQRPVSPPAPPNFGLAPPPSAAAAGGSSTVVQPQQQHPVSVTIAASSEKKAKKSRWAKAEEGNKGKFDQGARTNNFNNNMSSGGDLYNNFVEEQSNKDRPGSDSVYSPGKKRKMVDRYDSAPLPTANSNGGYYGPSTTVVDDDFMPFGLDKPLGGGAANTATKKEKKKAKKLLAKASSMGFEVSESAMNQRADRFKGKGDGSNVKSTIANVDQYMGKTVIGGSNRLLDEEDFERMTVKGTCKTLEKEYLRLTAPPRPELVRPQPILEKHLAALKKSYKKGGKHGGKQRDYTWYCSQFKALRQDLTVQRIFNAFAVDVYETHAKIALEEDDINEYNQSQTQLKELYDSIKGHEDKKENKGALKNENEFVAYRIIYYVYLSCNKKYEGGSSDIFKIMLQLTPEQREDAFISHALLGESCFRGGAAAVLVTLYLYLSNGFRLSPPVRAAVAENDYHKFFLLQDIAPNMGDYLMDKIVPSIRQFALQRICKAYRPDVSAAFVLKELGFDPKNERDTLGGKMWMESCGCKFDGDTFLTKDTALTESTMGVKNSLI